MIKFEAKVIKGAGNSMIYIPVRFNKKIKPGNYVLVELKKMNDVK